MLDMPIAGDHQLSEAATEAINPNELADLWPIKAAALFTLIAAPVVFAVAVCGQSERGEFLGYLAIVVVGSLASGALWQLLDRRSSAYPASWFPTASLILLLASVGLILLVLVDRWQPWLAGHLQADVLLSVLFTLSAVSAGLIGCALCQRPVLGTMMLPRSPRILVAIVLGSLIAFLSVFSPLFVREPTVSGFAWIFASPAFLTSFGLAWLTVVLSPRLLAPDSTLGATLATLVIALVFAVMLFDDGNFLMYDHYVAYVAPALHAGHGGVPMVDVYSQYGILPWALLRLAYYFLPGTIWTAGLIVRLVTVIWYCVFVLTVFCLVKNKLLVSRSSLSGSPWISSFTPIYPDWISAALTSTAFHPRRVIVICCLRS
jgi:hypothetical protein